MIAILDYGFGNVRSAQRAFARHGLDAEIAFDKNTCIEASGLVIPGVGAFAACMDGLDRVSAEAIIDARLVANRPTLGICVGMQVLFTTGVEHGRSRTGLSQWPGRVDQLKAEVLPHMGWSEVHAPSDSVLFRGVADQRFYFVHSYFVDCAHENDLLTMTNYGNSFVSSFEHENLIGVQFHPEKSHRFGISLFKNFLQYY